MRGNVAQKSVALKTAACAQPGSTSAFHTLTSHQLYERPRDRAEIKQPEHSVANISRHKRHSSIRVLLFRESETAEQPEQIIQGKRISGRISV